MVWYLFSLATVSQSLISIHLVGLTSLVLLVCRLLLSGGIMRLHFLRQHGTFERLLFSMLLGQVFRNRFAGLAYSTKTI
jgi:hypothetical protein